MRSPSTDQGSRGFFALLCMVLLVLGSANALAATHDSSGGASAVTTASLHVYDGPAQLVRSRETSSNGVMDNAVKPARQQRAVARDRAVAATSRVAAEGGGARFVAGADGITDTLGGAPNAVTLGRYPGYVRAAAMDGSRTFNLGDAWEGMAARADRFGGVGPGSEVSIRNMRFLDKAIADGSEIRLSSDPLDPANAGSAFLDEIGYLTKQGYSLQGNRMVP